MSEYSDSSSISKFIGSNPGYIGYEQGGELTEAIKRRPYSVILFDEIEKAHPKIINLLYQVLEDGKIKDNKNNVINFSNNIIIMTSNIGNKNTSIGFNNSVDTLNNDLVDNFGIAFINRIDDIISFNTLLKQDINKIIDIEIKNLKEKYKNIKITISPNIINEIAEESKYIDYGARKISKIIKNNIENIIIDNIIEDNKEINIDSIFSK